MSEFDCCQVHQRGRKKNIKPSMGEKVARGTFEGQLSVDAARP